jgi:hypothetical protein
MADILSEKMLRLEEVANLTGAHFTSVYRWVLRGVPGPDGRRIKLEAIRMGRCWITSHEALRRYSEALTPQPDDDGVIPPMAPRSPSRRRKASERAARELAKAGI